MRNKKLLICLTLVFIVFALILFLYKTRSNNQDSLPKYDIKIQYYNGRLMPGGISDTTTWILINIDKHRKYTVKYEHVYGATDEQNGEYYTILNEEVLSNKEIDNILKYKELAPENIEAGESYWKIEFEDKTIETKNFSF